MEHVDIAKLSSKGQIVLPQAIRKKLHLVEGERFFVFCGQDAVVLKKVEKPPMERIKELVKEARAYAKRAGLTQDDVKQAIRQARSHKS